MWTEARICLSLAALMPRAAWCGLRHSRGQATTRGPNPNTILCLVGDPAGCSHPGVKPQQSTWT